MGNIPPVDGPIEPADPERALPDLEAAVDDALAAVPADAAVAFSGGVDSALVATATEGPCIVAGFPGSPDLEAARDAARAMDRELEVVVLDHERLRAAAATLVDALGTTDAMAIEIAIPLHVVARASADDGATHLALGQGADELFGGYEKVANAPTDERLAAETVREAVREVLEGLPAGLSRDARAIRAGGVEPVFPLVEPEVVRAAMALPASLLVDDRGERKVALRKMARRRLPARVAYREKRAVQYGTHVARELDRLARDAGFKRREGDHVARYLASLD